MQHYSGNQGDCQAGIICYYIFLVFAGRFIQENIVCAKEVSILQRTSKGRFTEMTRFLADEDG
jgi:hypothetical protein